jgi:hypothetical protein
MANYQSLLGFTEKRSQSRFAVVIGLASLSTSLLFGQEPSTIVRDQDASVSCVVTRPSLPAAPRGDADYLTIDLRLPGTPPAAILSRLPAASRDFSTLPIHVFLVPAPARNSTTAPRLRRTDPLSVQATFLHPLINGAPAPDLYVRVTYPRDVLKGGVDVVAERSVQVPNGQQVSSQTRCRITAAVAANWQ